MTELNRNAEYSFGCNGEPLVERVVFLTGIGRSGTSLIGNLVGSFKNVEYEYEPWIFHCIPIMAASGQIKRKAAVEILRGYCQEMLTADILGRNVNVRPTDESRIWNRKSVEEIFSRWYQIRDRNDVKHYVTRTKTIFSIKAVNLGPFLSLLLDAFPNAKIINIVRHPVSVASSIERKGWVNIGQLQRVEGLPIKKRVKNENGEDIYIPWWVEEEDIPSFLKSSEFERALYCWRVLSEKTENEKQKFSTDTKNYLEVRYEDLLKTPRKFVDQLSQFVDAPVTEKTEDLIRNIRTERLNDKKMFKHEFDNSGKQRLMPLMELYHYDYETAQAI